MMKKRKIVTRFLASLLALVLVFGLIPLGAMATEGQVSAAPLSGETLIGYWDVTEEPADGFLQPGAAPDPLRSAQRELAAGVDVRFRSANNGENRFQLSTQASRRTLRSNGGTDDAFVEIHGVPDGDFRIVVSGQTEGSFGPITAANLNARLGIGGNAAAPAVTSMTGSIPQARASVESITLDFARTGNEGGNIASFLLVRDGNSVRVHGRLEITEIRLYALSDVPPMDTAASPQNLAASAQMEAVHLTWNAVPRATHHEVSFREYPSGTFNAWQTTTAQSNHTVSSLTTGVEYEFRVRAHDGTNASAYSTVRGTPLAPTPLIAITGIAVDGTHNFGAVSHDYTAADFTPLSITVTNNGTGVANHLTATLTSGNLSFALSNANLGNLAVDASETFTIQPQLLLPGGLHSGTVTITADGAAPVSFNVTFDVGFQDAPVNWDTQATYLWDFRNFPSYMLNFGGTDNRNLYLVLRDNVLSSMLHSTYQVAPTASRPNLDWMINQGLPNQGVRPSGTFASGATFIEPNGIGRGLATTEALSGPIRVEFVAHSTITGGTAHIPISFGDQLITLTITGNAVNPTTTSAVFTGLEEELLSFEWPWGTAGMTIPPGRPGIQAIRIYEGEFTGPWLSVPTGTEIAFRGLTENYLPADLETETVVLSNVGMGATNISYDISPGFVVTGMPASLNAGTEATITVRPAMGLAPGLHETTLLITTNNANTIHIPVSVVVFPTPTFPSDADLFYDGAPTSASTEFPNVLTEIPDWDHDFRRIVFTEGSHTAKMNGHDRDVSASLAIPFMQNEVLWVPIEAARWAMPNATFTLAADGTLNVTSPTGTYEGMALIATQALHGGEAVFVAIENIARGIGANFGVDTRSNTIIVTTGTFRQDNVLWGEMNHQAEAWYGSPNSLAIANNLVYLQRNNGGWPRGNGQINAAPFSPDIGGMSAQSVQTIHAARTANDSYFGRGISTFEPRFLLRMYEVTGIERFRDSGLLGLDTILSTQDPQGGWPYNIVGGDYHRALSISDNALAHILTLLMDIDGGLFHDTIGTARAEDSSAAYALGLDFILRTQQRSSGFADGVERLTAWAFAVYQSNLPTPPAAVTNHLNFRPGTPGQPAWQREFEPPGITNNESVGIVRFLMSIEDPTPEIIDAVSAAVFYFDYVAIRGYRFHFDDFGPLHPLYNRHLVPDPDARHVWSRFIDIETLTPLFSDRYLAVVTGSPHSGVLASDFEAEFGPWPGVPFSSLSQNSTSTTSARGGTLRNLYRMPDGTFTTDRSAGVFDIQATYRNLSFERRIGYHYMGHWPESLPGEYAEWRVRIGLDANRTALTEAIALAEARVQSNYTAASWQAFAAALANAQAVFANADATQAEIDAAALALTSAMSALARPGPGDGGGTAPPVPVITITTQPTANTNVTAGAIHTSLGVTATVTQNASLSFRWYRASDADRSAASTFTGITTAVFPKPTNLTVGTHYFYVVVSAPGATSVPSSVARVVVTAAARPFPFVDVPPNHWAREYVEFIWERDLVQGTSATTFSPSTPLSRAMMITILWREAGSPTASGGGFSDVAHGQWYTTAVAWAKEHDIVQGIGGGLFAPSRAITREEMAVILHRYAEAFDLELPSNSGSAFTDFDTVSVWAKDAVSAMQGAEIILGLPGGHFAPQDTALRAEVAAVIARFVQAIA